MPYDRFVYRVQYVRTAAPDAWWTTRNIGHERLVLSASSPLFSVARRLVVFARLVSEQPSRGSAGRLTSPESTFVLTPSGHPGLVLSRSGILSVDSRPLRWRHGGLLPM